MNSVRSFEICLGLNNQLHNFDRKFLNNYTLFHSFHYANPDSYLTHCPEIDELIYMVEILEIVRSEFGVWND